MFQNYDKKNQTLIGEENTALDNEYGECERKTKALAVIHSVVRRLELQSSQVSIEPCLQDIVLEEQIPNIG